MRLQVGPYFDSRFYRQVAEEYANYIKRFCAIKPNASILDIGCGTGSIAIALTKYLGQNGKYEGFDINDTMIEWCKKNISSTYPNFHFQFSDVFNKRYNPKGRCKASQYKFPYENESFDFVLVKSVFTHMLPKDMENYLYEVARVLKKNGHSLITYLLLNPESLGLMSKKLATLGDFKYVFTNYRVIDKITPESAVCYDEKYIRSIYKKFKLNIIKPIYYGSWCGRKKFLGFQDIVIASK